ncbi:unnamed protein product [Wuchereria bancrofti]|uniref:Uncharacterized protein n=1 Tax=Wuchereria bancrofti TaxID=6293 RepID=A0A3P7DTZ9_WUCBA|nr:unnamed protein product [Wuchereria bancrofti]
MTDHQFMNEFEINLRLKLSQMSLIYKRPQYIWLLLGLHFILFHLFSLIFHYFMIFGTINNILELTDLMHKCGAVFLRYFLK